MALLEEAEAQLALFGQQIGDAGDLRTVRGVQGGSKNMSLHAKELYIYLPYAVPDTANTRCPAPSEVDGVSRSAETDNLET